MRTMTEMTCHRRDFIWKSFTMEMKPAALSASSSCRISSISASTSSQPRSLCSAKGGEQRAALGWTRRPRSRGAASLPLSSSHRRASPLLAAAESFFWTSRYLGLSGKKGSRRSCSAAGTPVTPRRIGQPERKPASYPRAGSSAASPRGPLQPRSPPLVPSSPHGAQPAALVHYPDGFASELGDRL